ncbi:MULTISPECIES: hypothetical protein [Faecalibacterium]|jgi:hypothetical protein|uniref:hypothetical protein n=1 Tax=Faecalibacterium TaxID=216851 RepID=UPI000E557C33|nr:MULTISPECIES: hypothetical protein [Faecalibacterium]RHQ27541.1 hypothetical protein DWY95_08250 [Faecalibacterium sp. AF28-13AC]DAZ79142.1 MAG TPA: hypothetical protein [Caudoviricetes sp.]
MKKWTKDFLEANGYELRNAYIKNVSFGIKDYGFLSLALTLEGDGWGVNYIGPSIGRRFYINGELIKDGNAANFEGYEGGAEAIVRILDVVDCSELESLKGKYIRAAIKRGESVKIIGNIIKDQWFDYGSFFDDYKTKQECDRDDS